MPQQSTSSSHQPVYRENFPHHSPNPDSMLHSMLPQFRQHGRGRHLGVTAYKQWHSDLQTRVVSGSHSGAVAKKGGILLANPRNPRSCIRAAMINQRLRAILDNSPTVSVRFPRVPTSVCVAMDKFPGAQNFSVSPKKPTLLNRGFAFGSIKLVTRPESPGAGFHQRRLSGSSHALRLCGSPPA
jgi:hypothetical protein